MADGTDGAVALDRRTVLGCVAGATAGLTPVAAAHASPTADDASLTVLTRNLYLGVSLSRLFRVDSTAELRRAVGDLLDRAETHPYAPRIDAIAAEVESANPDVVALQEATAIRRRPPDGDGDWTEVVDLLSLLESALADRGLAYEVAASTVTTDATYRAERDDGQVEVGLTDRDALLVRSDLETDDVRTGTYGARLTLPIPGSDTVVSLRRGYCLADVTLGDHETTVCSTHLESVSSFVRFLQAGELLDAVPSDGRVVLAGDFNSGPGRNTDAYDRLTETFADPWPARRPDDDGFTCCQAATLRNERSLLSERIDAVLHRGALGPTAVSLVGADPDDRVTVDRDDETVAVWPSDHAGVVATFELESATPTTTPTRTASPTATRTRTVTSTAGGASGTPATDSDAASTPTGRGSTQTRSGTREGPANGGGTGQTGPGFGVSGALAGVVSALVGLGVAALRRARRE